jgi:hypothetical protein
MTVTLPFGLTTQSMSGGSVFYINRAQEPGVSNPKEAQHELQQYSRMIGETPLVMKMPRRNGVPDGLIAIWGQVKLEQLDQESIKRLADRKGLKKGLLIDFLGNFVRSAKAGLPIYRIDGGPGFIWAATFDQKGHGLLRLAAVDASRFVTPSAEQPPTAQLPAATSEASETPQPEASTTTVKVQPEVADDATTIADTEKAKAAPEEGQSEATTDEKANDGVVPAPVAATSAVAEVSSSWGTGDYGSIAGLLLVVLTACTAVIYRKRYKAATVKGQALPCASSIEVEALPITGRALSPDAALVRIEEIRRSLLDLTSSPSLAPSAIPEEPILPTLPVEPRPKLVEPV